MIQFTRVTWCSQIFAIVLGVGIFAVGMYVGMVSERNALERLDATRQPQPNVDQAITEPAAVPNVVGFNWSFRPIDTTPEYPQTKVSVIVLRADGTEQETFLSNVDGTCNQMPVETVLALGSKQILCYFAGFGYQFRVIAARDGYEVQRKEIEEGSPEYTPPVAEFETVMNIK